MPSIFWVTADWRRGARIHASILDFRIAFCENECRVRRSASSLLLETWHLFYEIPVLAMNPFIIDLDAFLRSVFLGSFVASLMLCSVTVWAWHHPSTFVRDTATEAIVTSIKGLDRERIAHYLICYVLDRHKHKHKHKQQVTINFVTSILSLGRASVCVGRVDFHF